MLYGVLLMITCMHHGGPTSMLALRSPLISTLSKSLTSNLVSINLHSDIHSYTTLCLKAFSCPATFLQQIMVFTHTLQLAFTYCALNACIRSSNIVQNLRPWFLSYPIQRQKITCKQNIEGIISQYNERSGVALLEFLPSHLLKDDISISSAWILPLIFSIGVGHLFVELSKKDRQMCGKR